MRGQLKGDTQQERVRNWYDHFRNLLGKPPDIEDENEEIDPILEDLDIEIGPFTQEEYQEAKSSLHWLRGKAVGKTVYHQKS